MHSLTLAAWDVLIAVPLGVTLALGLARWRSRGSGGANFLMLFPLVTPEIVMGVSLLLLFTQLPPFTHIHTGGLAQVLGHVTFSISYVVVIVRGRMFSIGREYEEAAADLGASPGVALWKVLLPLLMPAIVASAAIVFAISIDDFVISQWLSSGPSTTTVPMEIYDATRAAPTPATNAIATVMVIVTLTSVVAGFRCGARSRAGSTVPSNRRCGTSPHSTCDPRAGTFVPPKPTRGDALWPVVKSS